MYFGKAIQISFKKSNIEKTSSMCKELQRSSMDCQSLNGSKNKNKQKTRPVCLTTRHRNSTYEAFTVPSENRTHVQARRLITKNAARWAN